jgi:integrase
MKRKLGDKLVTIHRRDGLRKRCGCPQRNWGDSKKCPHPWHFSFKWKPTETCPSGHHRFPIDRYAEGAIVTKDDARNEADRLRRLIRAGSFPPPSSTPAAPTTPSDLTFESFAEKWLTNARGQQSENQQLNERGIVRRFAKIELQPGQLLGLRPIGLFTLDDWESAFAKLASFAASTRNKYRQAILTMQEWAVEKGYLTRPWLTGRVLKKGGTIARRKGARRDRRLVPDVLDKDGKITQPGEERRLLDHASPYLQRLIVAVIEGCMRRQEALTLQWRDVDLARGRMTFRAENVKTRTVLQKPISPRLLGVLRMIEHDPAGNPHKPTAYVFGDAIGGELTFPKKQWAKALKGAGIEDLEFRDLRHEGACRLADRGWSLPQIQRMLGHQDAKTTSIYLHADILDLEEAMRRLGTQPLHDVAQTTESEPPPAVQRENNNAANVTIN